jgi:ATP-binding cassette subfamily B protein
VVRRFVPRRAALLLAITVASTALHAATPYVVGRFVDALDRLAPGPAALSELHGLLALLVAAWLVGPALGRLYTLANAFTMPRMRAEIDAALFDWTLRQPAAFFQEGSTGALTQQIRKAGQAAPNLFECFVLQFARVAVTLAVSGALLWTAQPAYAVAFLVFSAAFVALSLAMARSVEPVVERLARARSAVSGRIADALGASDVVRSFSGEEFERRALRPFLEEECDRGRRARIRFTLMRLSQLLLSAGFMTALLWAALGAAAEGRLTAGDVAMVLTIGVQLALSITQLGDDVLACFELVGDLAESLDALARPVPVADRPGAPRLAVRGGRVEFDRVGFAYPGGAEVLRDLSLIVRAGERLGLVGPSGAGKSTLLRLLTRRHEVGRGRIAIDGVDVAGVALDGLRSSIAEVSQSVELFHRSILENIRYARPSASEAEVVAAAEAARCDGFIRARPGGYGAVVGERGLRLSGGERQRIAIARAILKDAPILLLDEATSALDAESEAAIQEALAGLMRGRTVIAIAHRLSTVREMDRLVVLEAGRIVEAGSHDDLLAMGGRYAGLWRLQFGRVAVGG